MRSIIKTKNTFSEWSTVVCIAVFYLWPPSESTAGGEMLFYLTQADVRHAWQWHLHKWHVEIKVYVDGASAFLRQGQSALRGAARSSRARFFVCFVASDKSALVHGSARQLLGAIKPTKYRARPLLATPPQCRLAFNLSCNQWLILCYYARALFARRTNEDFADEVYLHPPVSAVHKMRWNPNLGSLTWVASGTHSGLVRLHCLSGMVTRDVASVCSRSRADDEAWRLHCYGHNARHCFVEILPCCEWPNC